MFGILRPCHHSLSSELASAWMSHLCGLCLALRDDHGQLARTAANYDGLVISALMEAQAAPGTGQREAGPCPLRGMRRATVSQGTGARLAATVSLLLAAAKVEDHVADRDGVYARRPVRGAARSMARRWTKQAEKTSGELSFDGGALLAVLERQQETERSAEVGTDILAVTEPTETATAAAFAHTAVLSERPDNGAALTEAGRLFGRVAHLLDAVEDQEEDRTCGAWNPLTATGTLPAEARRLCDDAALGVRLALDEAVFTDDRLVRTLLITELERAVHRTFNQAGHPPPDRRQGRRHHGGNDAGQGQYPAGSSRDPHPGYRDSGHGGYFENGYGDGGGPHNPQHSGHQGGGCGGSCCSTPKIWQPPKSRGILAGCAVSLFMACTCQFCCRDPHPGPWSGQPHRSCWNACKCGGCCECCDCGCKCCECCDCGC